MFRNIVLVAIVCLAGFSCSAPKPTPAADKPLTDFSQEITSTSTSLTLKAGAQSSVPITIRNSGTQAWPANGENAVHLSYFVTKDGKEIARDGARTFFKSDIRPGDSLPLQAVVVAPKEPGSYVLNFTMVQERVAWFDSAKGKILPIPVTVQ